MECTITIIVAHSENGVIGSENRLPWFIREDMQFFRQQTMGHPVILGRRTFESIGKPLDGRTNVVLSRTLRSAPHGCLIARSLSDALELACRHAPADRTVFIAGGQEVFEAVIDRADQIIRTRIHREFAGDAFFPEPVGWLWRQTWADTIETASGLRVTFEKLVRARQGTTSMPHGHNVGCCHHMRFGQLAASPLD